MKHLTLFLCLFLPALLAAQSNCDYDKLLREGKTFAKQRQYKKALYKYNSARRCDRDKGEEVDAAIEALLDQVEGEKKAADKERERAESAKMTADMERQRAEQALDDLRQTSGKVVESLLRDAENEIYHLRYAEALDKLNAAAEIGQKKPEVARALMEVAFFYAESKQYREAEAIVATISRLIDKHAGLVENPDTRAFRHALKNLDTARYAELETRYYPVMIPIPGGTFIMGSDDGEENERPVHKVQLSPFRMAETETTIWQFGLYCAAMGFDIKKFHNPAWGDIRGPDPVIYVSWYQAVLYANWASEQYGFEVMYKIEHLQIVNDKDIGFETIRKPGANGFCLPTEAEWEYAALGGQAFLYAGSDTLDSVGWYDSNSSRTNPVRVKKANGFGLYDMSGNVFEWCWDLYSDAYYQQFRDSAADNPAGSDESGGRVLRGGAWGFDPVSCRVACRILRYPLYRYNFIGFRAARH